MEFWSDLIWIGNTLYERWFVILAFVLILAALNASIYLGFVFLKFLFKLVTGPNA